MPPPTARRYRHPGPGAVGPVHKLTPGLGLPLAGEAVRAGELAGCRPSVSATADVPSVPPAGFANGGRLQAEDEAERGVDLPHLDRTQVPDWLTQAARVDRGGLLGQDPSRARGEVDLRAEGRRGC